MCKFESSQKSQAESSWLIPWKLASNREFLTVILRRIQKQMRPTQIFGMKRPWAEKCREALVHPNIMFSYFGFPRLAALHSPESRFLLFKTMLCGAQCFLCQKSKKATHTFASVARDSSHVSTNCNQSISAWDSWELVVDVMWRAWDRFVAVVNSLKFSINQSTHCRGPTRTAGLGLHYLFDVQSVCLRLDIGVVAWFSNRVVLLPCLSLSFFRCLSFNLQWTLVVFF